MKRRLQLPISYHYDVKPGSEPKLLLCLHGYAQELADAQQFGQKIALPWTRAALQAPYPHHRTQGRGQGRRIVGSSFSWVSSFEPDEAIANHHAFVRHVVDELYAEGLAAERRAVLFGFSQSVSLNYRFAAAYPDYTAGIIAVAGATPSSWNEALPTLKMPVLHISATEDPAYPAKRAAQFRAQLEACCSRLTWHEEPGGHRVPSAAYRVMRAWTQGGNAHGGEPHAR